MRTIDDIEAQRVVDNACQGFTTDTAIAELNMKHLRQSREHTAADFMMALDVLGLKEVRSQVMYPKGDRTIREIAQQEVIFFDRNNGETILYPSIDFSNPRYVVGPVIYSMGEHLQFADGFAIYERVGNQDAPTTVA